MKNYTVIKKYPADSKISLPVEDYNELIETYNACQVILTENDKLRREIDYLDNVTLERDELREKLDKVERVVTTTTTTTKTKYPLKANGHPQFRKG